MRLSYDPETDSLYRHLSDRVSADSDEECDGVVLDYAADGFLVGVDVQHASRNMDISRRRADCRTAKWKRRSCKGRVPANGCW